MLAELCDKGSSSLAQKDLLFDSGIYPVYGAAGEITKVDFFHQSKPYLGLIKDGAGVGRVMKLPANSSVIGTIQYLFPRENVDLKYLYYLIKYLDLGKSNTGATIPHIYFKDYKKRKVKVREYSEQKHIGQTLELIDSHLSTYKNILDQYDLLIKSRFVEMFGDITARGRFKVKRWKDILDILNGRDYKNVLVNKGGYPVYGSGGIIARASDYICPAGTIIIGRKGSINNPILVNEKFWNVDTAFGIVPKETINKNYLFYFCKQYNFNRLNKATTLPSLTKQDLLEIEINIPDLEKQVKFSRFVDQINKLKFAQIVYN
mgnify:CR=1 FL=1